MSAVVVSASLRDWLLKKPAWLDHQTAVGLTFAVKTFAASLLALYIVAKDFRQGLLIKLPGRVDLDPQSGRITTIFDDLPPVDD